MVFPVTLPTVRRMALRFFDPDRPDQVIGCIEFLLSKGADPNISGGSWEIADSCCYWKDKPTSNQSLSLWLDIVFSTMRPAPKVASVQGGDVDSDLYSCFTRTCLRGRLVRRLRIEPIQELRVPFCEVLPIGVRQLNVTALILSSILGTPLRPPRRVLRIRS